MEQLDTYDENKNYLGEENRDVVHNLGLWHNTVHCWLYDKEGNIYFQIRNDVGTLYTTASGHVLAKETIKEAFGREIKEEIGLKVDYEEAKFINEVIWKMDKERPDGSIFKDRAFANVYACEFDGDYEDFNFGISEVKGVVRVNAKKALNLFKKGEGFITGQVITLENKLNSIINKNIQIEEFLVNNGETLLIKYGDVLRFVIKLTSK